MLFILTDLILRTILDSELLQGGIQDFGKTLSIQVVTTNLGSYHSWWLVARKVWMKSLLKKEKLGELEYTGWWYQWLGQALLIMAERSVVLAQSTHCSCAGSLQMNRPNFSHVRGERCPRSLMTSMTIGQGSDKSAEKSMERRVSWQAWTTGERGARSHNSAVTSKQKQISRAQYDARDIYEGRIYPPYGHDD